MFIDVTILFCSFFLLVALIIAFKGRKTFQKTQSYVFFGLLIILALNSLMSGISNLIEDAVVATGALFVVQYVTQMIFFLVHNALAPFYAYYVMLVNGVAIHTDRKKLLTYSIPFVLLECFFLTNPWTNLLFTYDATAEYHRGPFFFTLYAVALFYIVISITYMIKYRKLVSKETNFMLWLFFSFTIFGVVVQAIFPELKIELYAEALSSIGIMLSIEEERDLLDSASGLYNRRAFMNDNRRLIETNHKYAVITISITNIRLFVHILNYKAMSETVKKIAKWLLKLRKNTVVYRITTGNFALIYLYDDAKDVTELTNEIKSRFDIGWDYGGAPLDFNIQIKTVMVPEDTDKPSSLLDLAEENSTSDIAGVKIVDKKDIQSIVKRGAIEANIRKALSNDGFEVYFQPIWGVKAEKFVAAEALVRLNNSELGFISPAEFIPVAESTGLIGEIGLIVFEKVCKFLAREDVKAMNLACIDVNLSLYQLIVGNVPDKFSSIMKKYGIDPRQINLEITESAEIEGQGTITNAIQELRSVGFRFSLDDFGTGYANMADMIAMRFDIIKSDKGILWDSAKDPMAKAILTSYIKLIRKIGMDVVQEGVETKEQLDLVVNAGANFIQGYYFSKPLPEDEFVELLS